MRIVNDDVALELSSFKHTASCGMSMIRQSMRDRTAVLPPGSDLETDTPELLFSARWIRDVESLRDATPAWNRLVECSIHDNLHYSPQFLIPALERGPAGAVGLLVIEAPPMIDLQGPPVWCALLPLARQSVHGLPATCLGLWNPRPGLDTTPLIRRDCGEEALRFAFSTLAQQQIELLSFDANSGDSPFDEIWQGAVEQSSTGQWKTRRPAQRCFRPGDNVAHYLRTRVSKATRREALQRRRQLEMQGDVEIVLSDPSSDVSQLSQTFFELRTAHSAAATATPNEPPAVPQEFLERAITAGARHGHVQFHSLLLNGHTIAMRCQLNSRQSGVLLGTVSDPGFAAQRPAFLLEIASLESLHDKLVNVLECLPGCGDEDVLDRIWFDQSQACQGIVSLQSGGAKWIRRCLPVVNRAIQFWRRCQPTFLRRDRPALER